MDVGQTLTPLEPIRSQVLDIRGPSSSNNKQNPNKSDNQPPPLPKPNPKPKGQKTVRQAADALLKKMSLKLTEGEGIETMLRKGGMPLGFHKRVF